MSDPKMRKRSVTSKDHPDWGKPERVVKLDYSSIYQENDELTECLESRLGTLHKAQFRMVTTKTDQFLKAKKDAEKIINLKEVVNQRDPGKDTLNLFVGSTKLATKQEGDTEQANELQVVNPPQANPPADKSITMRRIQRERDKFSAKNHFNVTLPRPTATSFSANDSSDSPVLRRSASVVQLPLKAQNIRNNDAPQYRRKGYLSPTSSSLSRLARPRSVPVRLSNEPELSGNTGPEGSKYTRSRRELQELSQLEQFLSRPQTVSKQSIRATMLFALDDYQRDLQRRVAYFVKDLELFNRKTKKPSLEEILNS